jgi:hypothetical protein
MSLMLGETLRSWGQGRNPVFVLDDFLIGIPLVFTALLLGRPTVARHCAFAASWAAAAGMLYGSFFGKLLGPVRSFDSNLADGLLTFLIGLAFASAVAGLVASLLLAGDAERRFVFDGASGMRRHGAPSALQGRAYRREEQP